MKYLIPAAGLSLLLWLYWPAIEKHVPLVVSVILTAALALLMIVLAHFWPAP